MMNTPLVSIVIPVWNGLLYLQDCLDALLSSVAVEMEIIVVDNASPDGAADFVAKNYQQIHLIRNQRNLGFAGGCNIGLRVARGDVLVLLNQDTIVAPNCLRILSDALQNHKIGVVGCKIFYPDGETIQHAGGWIEWPLGEARHYGQHERDTGKWDIARMVEYVTGAAMAFRRDVLEKVGFLDEDFWPGYFEDADFCLRVSRADYEIWYIPEATLTHVETTSLTDPSLIWQFYHQGRLRFLLKHVAPDQFLTQFVPAEELHQMTVIGTLGNQPLSRAYLEAIPRAAPILHHYWQAKQGTINEVIEAFQHLRSSAWERGWQKIEESIKSVADSPPSIYQSGYEVSLSEMTTTPKLQEFEFRSAVPIVGPFIDRFRSFWYGIAAQWGIRHLMQQQEAINQYYQRHIQYYQRYIEALEQRLTELADENTFLAKEIANLNWHYIDSRCGEESCSPYISNTIQNGEVSSHLGQ